MGPLQAVMASTSSGGGRDAEEHGYVHIHHSKLSIASLPTPLPSLASVASHLLFIVFFYDPNLLMPIAPPYLQNIQA